MVRSHLSEILASAAFQTANSGCTSSHRGQPRTGLLVGYKILLCLFHFAICLFNIAPEFLLGATDASPPHHKKKLPCSLVKGICCRKPINKVGVAAAGAIGETGGRRRGNLCVSESVCARLYAHGAINPAGDDTCEWQCRWGGSRRGGAINLIDLQDGSKATLLSSGCCFFTLISMATVYWVDFFPSLTLQNVYMN